MSFFSRLFPPRLRSGASFSNRPKHAFWGELLNGLKLVMRDVEKGGWEQREGSWE